MIGTSAHTEALRGYLDALLQDPAPPDPGRGGTMAKWQLCRLGRLQVLLPNDSIGASIDAASLNPAPATWHLAQVSINANDWRVAELGDCVAPGLECSPVETLLAIHGGRWLLAVPGQPTLLALRHDAIQWRQQRSSRPWLSGISDDSQYLVLDVPSLIAQVDAAAGVA